jgi:hypothetical protein
MWPMASSSPAFVWDIGLIGVGPERAKRIAFTPAYVEILDGGFTVIQQAIGAT